MVDKSVDKDKCEEYLSKWDKTVWSYSRVSSYLQCPYSWYETYVLGNRGGNFYAYIGTAYHKVMEDYYNFMLAGGELDIDVIKDTLKKKLKAKFKKNPFRDRNSASQYKTLIDSINHFKIFDDVTFVERLVKWEIDEYKFRGYIDLDAGRDYHYDWKSRFDIKKYGNQQNLYLFAKEQVDGVVTKGYKIPQYKDELSVEVIKRDQREINSTIEWVRYTIPKIKESLEGGEFRKNPSNQFFCRFLCGAKKCEHRRR